MKKLAFLFLLILGSLLPQPVQALENPNFPSCLAPTGTVVASYASGTHGIVGSNETYTGSDTVYSLGEGNYVQCFCDNGRGIQTNWWKTNTSDENWISIPNGENWGLESGSYLAQNLDYNCGASANNGNNGSGGSGGGNPSAPTCNDAAPSSAPYLYKIDRGENTATLYWTKAQDPVSYYLVAYGTTPGNYIYGNPNVGGKETTSYTVTGLSGGVTYYFVVRAGNGCKPGPFSSEISTNPTGGVGFGQAVGFYPGVLGIDDRLGKGGATSSAEFAEVIGATTSKNCANCLWWPILLGEAGLLALYYFLVRKNEYFRRHLAVGGVIAALAYLVFLILNQGQCAEGVIDLKVITLPCKLFWVLDAGVYALADLLFAKFHSSR